MMHTFAQSRSRIYSSYRMVYWKYVSSDNVAPQIPTFHEIPRFWGRIRPETLSIISPLYSFLVSGPRVHVRERKFSQSHPARFFEIRGPRSHLVNALTRWISGSVGFYLGRVATAFTRWNLRSLSLTFNVRA